MAFLPMMKFLVSPEHPQSSTGAMGDAGFWTGEPDVQVSLAAQDAESSRISRKSGAGVGDWMCSTVLGGFLAPGPTPGKPGPGAVPRGAWVQLPYICVGLAPTVIFRSQTSPPLGGSRVSEILLRAIGTIKKKNHTSKKLNTWSQIF